MKPVKIHDKLNPHNAGITLWTHEALQAITKNSGPLTKTNEYQVHYWSLNFRKKFVDDSIIDISIPTVFFNYEQQVSGAAIDFELKDVEAISDMIKPLHDVEVSKLDKLLAGTFLKDFQFQSVALNSLHKHPGGRRQGFSGTDLKTDHEHNTGIVFPLAQADIQANFASIMCIDGGTTYLAHSEYRIANGKVSDDKGISYYEGRCCSYIKVPKPSQSEAEAFLDLEVEDLSYMEGRGLEASPLLDKVTELWDSLDYQSNTDFIKEANVSKKEAVVTSRNWANPSKPVTTVLSDIDKTVSSEININLSLAPDALQVVYTSTFTTKQIRDGIMSLFEATGIVFYSENALDNLTIPQFDAHWEKIHAHYFGGPLTDLEKVEGFEVFEMVELQEIVLEEHLFETLLSGAEL